MGSSFLGKISGFETIMDQEDTSVTRWLGLLKDGDQQAAQRIWDKYSNQLYRLAQRILQGIPDRVADPDQAIVDAFLSFLDLVRESNYKQLDDRNDVLQLLTMLTVRKTLNQRRYWKGLRLGLNQTVGESRLKSPNLAESNPAGIDQAAIHEESPDLATILSDELEHLAKLLASHDPPDKHRFQELLRLQWEGFCRRPEGYTQDEIAKKMNVDRRTVQRKLKLIRQIWESENQDQD